MVFSGKQLECKGVDACSFQAMQEMRVNSPTVLYYRPERSSTTSGEDWISRGERTVSTDDTLFFQQSWQHLMGSLDTMLDDARANAATLTESRPAIDELLARAEVQHQAAETALRELAAQRTKLAATLDEVQRELAVAGVPLRGEIT